MNAVRLTCPIENPAELSTLTAGTPVLLSGSIITGRDAAHARLHELILAGRPLPVELANQVIYYVGPAPAAPAHVIGAAGPTTASRMDPFTPELLERGLKGMIGKGYRSYAVTQAIIQHKAVYFGAIGGLGALLSRFIVSQQLVAFGDLGPEAIYTFAIKDFPVIVLTDTEGHDFYRSNQAAWQSNE